jgi:hypothetical protein
MTGQRASHVDGEHVKQGLVIWGASGHALVVVDIISLVNAYQIIGMIDHINPERRLGIRRIRGAAWAREARQSVAEGSADDDRRIR